MVRSEMVDMVDGFFLNSYEMGFFIVHLLEL